MSGRHGLIQVVIRNKAQHAIWIHCIIHREALVPKSMITELNSILERVIDKVNDIKTRLLKAFK